MANDKFLDMHPKKVWQWPKAKTILEAIEMGPDWVKPVERVEGLPYTPFLDSSRVEIFHTDIEGHVVLKVFTSYGSRDLWIKCSPGDFIIKEYGGVLSVRTKKAFHERYKVLNG